MEISTKLKERFCKDCNVPIKLFKEPYFSSRLALMDSQFDTISKYETFKKELEKYNTEQDYFEAYNKLKDNMINYIKNSEGFKRFNNEDFNKYSVNNYNVPSKDIFKSYNIGRELLSIDMVKANFTSLRHYDETIFDGCKTYEEFVRKFTDSEHFTTSKYIRQVVFGNINPKRQVTYEKYLMGQVLDKLVDVVEIEKIVYFTNDEIVIDITDLEESYTKKIYEIVKESQVELRTERFRLYNVKGTEGFVKSFGDGTFEFKCIDSLMYPFVLRAYNNEEIKEEDTIFYHEGRLAKILELPEITVVK